MLRKTIPLTKNFTPLGVFLICGVSFAGYKGNMYEVIGFATHSETEEPMVVYRVLYGEHCIKIYV